VELVVEARSRQVLFVDIDQPLHDLLHVAIARLYFLGLCRVRKKMSRKTKID